MRKLCLTRLLRAVTKPWQTLIEQEPGAGESERWRRTVRMPNHFTLQTQQAVRRIRRETHTYTSGGAHTLSNARLHLERGKTHQHTGGKKTCAATNNKQRKAKTKTRSLQLSDSANNHSSYGLSIPMFLSAASFFNICEGSFFFFFLFNLPQK